MRLQHVTLIGCLSLFLMSCGLLESKSNGRSRSPAAPAEGEPGSGDAVVDEGEPAARPPVDAPTKDSAAMALTGKDLYAKLCASCHGKFEESTLGKTPVNKVNMAIASVPDMADLKDTKPEELEAIVQALSELSPGKGKGGKAVDAGQE